jgi:transcriptional regulator GlxA family with amidase domain
MPSATAARLAALIEKWTPLEGAQPAPIAGVHCIKITRPLHGKAHWRASFCIAAQGTKELLVEGRRYRETEPHYIVSPIDLPVTSRVTRASRAFPLLAVKLRFDAHAVREVAAQLDRTAEPREASGRDGRAIFVGRASERMLDAAVRMCELFETPDDAAVLCPLISRELIFHLLKGPDGSAIRELVRAGSQAHRIAEAIYRLQSSLDEDVDIDKLARAAGMSRAAFFKHFKDATAMSPLQYQKRLRLLEARRLMLEEAEGAEAAAFRVGYASPSQFSREYSRMFGQPPLRDKRAIEQKAIAVADM